MTGAFQCCLFKYSCELSRHYYSPPPSSRKQTQWPPINKKRKRTKLTYNLAKHCQLRCSNTLVCMIRATKGGKKKGKMRGRKWIIPLIYMKVRYRYINLFIHSHMHRNTRTHTLAHAHTSARTHIHTREHKHTTHFVILIHLRSNVININNNFFIKCTRDMRFVTATIHHSSYQLH